MKYFAVMNDGRVIKAEDVAKTSTGSIYFTIDNDWFRYAPYDTYNINPFNYHPFIKPCYFQKFIQGSWCEDRQIENLYELNETEDEELNYFETTDFNAGIIYSKVERVLAPALNKTKLKIVEGTITLPRIQLLPKIMFNDATEEGVLKNICNRVITHFNAVYGKTFELTFPEVNEEGKYYIVFHFEITRKEEYKEMTIAEIEEALGYKIKVVK